MLQSAFTRPALRRNAFMIFTENMRKRDENTKYAGGEGDDERRRILSVQREESKDRSERREIPGILYRRRKTISLKLCSVSLSSTESFVFFFSLFFLAKLTSKFARRRHTLRSRAAFNFI